MRIKLIVSVVVLLIWTNAFAQDANDKKAFTTATKGLVGEWVNELGSPLKIISIDLSSGQISGIYKSSSGTSGKSYPLIGWVNYQSPRPGGDNVVVVCFSVHWGEYGSVTTWNGTYYPQSPSPEIKTQWLLVRSNSKFEWDHTHIGSSTFLPKTDAR
jgi:hypothetical protein